LGREVGPEPGPSSDGIADGLLVAKELLPPDIGSIGIDATEDAATFVASNVDVAMTFKSELGNIGTTFVYGALPVDGAAVLITIVLCEIVKLLAFV
jgi:hypothetical protein